VRTTANIVVAVDHRGIEPALKKLKKEFLKTGLNRDMRRHMFYVKPGERRRRKSAAARKKLRKAQLKRELAVPSHA